MLKIDPDFQDSYSEAETVARRELALKRAFTMPHKPHQSSKAAKEKQASGKV